MLISWNIPKAKFKYGQRFEHLTITRNFDCDCDCSWPLLLLETRPFLTVRAKGRAGEFPVGETNRSQTATDVVMVIR